jgi:SAM-dependent methyltransferase
VLAKLLSAADLALKFAVPASSRKGVRVSALVDTSKDEGTFDSAVYMRWEDLDRASEAWLSADGAPGSAFDEFRSKYLPLPDWYDSTLDPLSPAYLQQQDRLWQMMVGEDGALYEPASDEQTGVDQSRALVRPGLYSSKMERAGDHLIAMGHILKHAKLKARDRVLEYGAGYGQIALTLARMGMIVDTVDVDPGFCSAVQAQADWFQVSLKAHQGVFGDNPSGERYAVILFYEAFHHAREFVALIPRLRELLIPGGKIIMAGEPFADSSDKPFAKAVPYPWGMRLNADNAAIVRHRRWYELGFRDEFLFDLFDRHGFTPTKHPGEISHYANVYTFEMRQSLIALRDWQGAPHCASGWHGRESGGRWTKSEALFPVERLPYWSAVRVSCMNHHPRSQRVEFEMGNTKRTIVLAPRQAMEVYLDRDEGAKMIKILCETVRPTSYGLPDDRELGILVKEVEFLKGGAEELAA